MHSKITMWEVWGWIISEDTQSSRHQAAMVSKPIFHFIQFIYEPTDVTKTT